MASQQPDDFFGSSIGDQIMMQEVLELLATEDASSNQEQTSDSSSNNNNAGRDSSVAGPNHGDNETMWSTQDLRGPGVMHEEARQQKQQLQELHAELMKLQDLEVEISQYQQRSVESLQEELDARSEELNELMAQVEIAAKEEVDLINMIRKNLGE
ncbi:hypothetical protein PHYBOEH_010717 [Phytophthora boehmeriae]|uniref:Uncharacterized protein n=1 Tax=Phytophthora boehmeriae TaxID=109152 RepID=A0A8T1X2J6_9STRA|nr:hypothetical protein PHYBOEH_010717 [Phytophthora boehmeriae]